MTTNDRGFCGDSPADLDPREVGGQRVELLAGPLVIRMVVAVGDWIWMPRKIRETSAAISLGSPSWAKIGPISPSVLGVPGGADHLGGDLVPRRVRLELLLEPAFEDVLNEPHPLVRGPGEDHLPPVTGPVLREGVRAEQFVDRLLRLSGSAFEAEEVTSLAVGTVPARSSVTRRRKSSSLVRGPGMTDSFARWAAIRRSTSWQSSATC